MTLRKIFLFFILLSFPFAFGQLVQPFAIRYQANHKGNITYISNAGLTCTGGTCGTAQNYATSSISSNNYNNNNFTMNYIDVDGTGNTTFMSSSDSLNLLNCSEITWAGLYWSAANSNTPVSNPTGYANRNFVKLKVNNGAYQTLQADQIINNTQQYQSYFCFKDITSIAQTSGIKARYTIADMICWNGGTNLSGGWTIVVVFKNVNFTDRNLTVFDGLSVVSNNNTTTIPISGFLTPLSGPVNFELGVISLDGDRGSTGDALTFNGAGAYVPISDAMHIASNSFNSSITNNGVLTPFRLPSYNNTLGYDASIYAPINTTQNYLGNSATNANIRISSTGDVILTPVVTSAIDIYQPDLRATVSYTDLNGGQIMANDILEYKIKCVNIGSDPSVNTYVLDTLDIRTNLVPGTLQVFYGPNSGNKTDALADDQGEYNAANRTVKFRIGTGATGLVGGQVNNSVAGTDSTIVKFRVQVIDDCLLLNCDSTLTNLAYIYGNGNISGQLYTNGGTPNTFDVNGCPTTVNSNMIFHTVGCPPAAVSNSGPVCIGQSLQFTGPSSSLANYSWSGPNSFVSSTQNPLIANTTLLNSGTYNSIISFTGNTCTYNLSTTAVVNPLPTVSSNVTNVACFNTNTGQINLTPGANPTYTYSWSNGASTNPLTNLGIGTYTATYTDANGCVDSSTFNITQPTLLTVNANITSNYNGQNVSCFNSTNGTGSALASGGTAPYTYLWSNGSTNSNLSNVGAGTYIVDVTDVNGCHAFDTIILVNPPQITATASITSNFNGQNVSCFGSTNGSASVTASGGTPGYTYLWSPGGGTSSIRNNLGAGTYTVVVTDLNGCTSSSSVTLVNPPAVVPTAVITSNYNGQNVSCNGSQNGSASASATGGTPGYTYLWSNTATTSSITNIGAGTYSVTITDLNGCAASANVTLVNPPSINGTSAVTSNYNGQQISCSNSTNGIATASVSGGTPSYTYLWSNGATTATVSNLGAGPYSVTATDLNGCTVVISGNIVAPNPLNAPVTINSNFNGYNINCFGNSNGSASVTASGGTPGYTYLWSNNSNSNLALNLSAGNYSVTVTDLNGCTATTNLTLTQPPLLTANALVTSNFNGFNVSCFGSTNGTGIVTSNGGVPGYSYAWSNGSSNANLSNVGANTYSVVVTDINNCTANASISLIQPNVLNISSVNQNVSCFGGNNGSINATISGGVIPYTYLWTNGSTAQDINGLISGSYSLSLTDNNGCTQSFSTNISQPNLPLTLTESHSNVSCFGLANGSVNLNVVGGTSPYTYLWNSGATTQDIFNLPAGSYSVQVTDANGCISNLTVVISQPSATLTNSAVVSSAACFGQNSGNINLTVAGGTGPFSFSWSNGSFTEDLTNVSSGNYSVNITDANGCTTVGTYSIGQPSLPLAVSEIHQDILCFGTSTGSINVTISGGTGPYTYSWSNGALTEDLSSIPNGTYVITVSDANSCTTTTSVTISQLFAPISLSSTQINVACFQANTGSIDLTVVGGAPNYTYNWTGGFVTQDIGQLASGSYTVVVTDLYNCTSALTVNLTQPATPVILSETHIDNSCSAGITGSINLSVAGGVGPYTYLWNNNATSQDLFNLSSGLYTVQVTDALGCVTPLSIPIADPTNGINVLGVISNVACYGFGTGSINITASGGLPGYTYLWNNGSVTEDISFLVAGTYSVNVSDQSGCQFFTSFTVTQPDSALTYIQTIQNVVCFGQNTGVIYMNVWGGTPPYAFSWSNGDTTQSAYNLVAGTYSGFITDANECNSFVTATITQPPSAITASAVPLNISCFGTNTGSINLTPSGGVPPYTFSWSNGSNTEDISNVQAGIYSVTIMDSIGCTHSVSTTITQPANALSLGVSTVNVSCFGLSNGSINLTPSFGTSPYSYAWSNGASSQDLNNIAAGIYTVTTTDANGCIAILTAQITQPATTLVSTIQHTNVPCHNGASGTGTAAGLGGTPPYSYTWSNGQTTAFVDSLLAGIYSVVISDNNGCTSSQSVLVTQPAPIVIQSANVNNLCFGQTSGSINLTVFGGAVPYAYLWSNGATTDSIGGLGAGPYFVTVTDDNACTATYSDTITQPASSIALSVLITNNLCFGYGNGAIDLTAIGGTAPYQFQWNNGSLSQDIQNLTAGIYTVAVIDQNGCLVTDTFTVNQPPAAAIVTAVNANVSCFGGNNGAINLTVTGPNPPFTYLWSNGATTQDIFNLVPGAYTNNITNANGCVTSYTVNITQPAAPISIQSINTNVLCYAQNTGVIDLSVFGGVAPYTYLWSNLTATQDLNNIPAGIYSVTVTDAGGCQTTFNTQLTQPAAPIAASTATANVLCFGQSTGAIDLTVGGGSAPYVYTWSNAATSQDINGLPIGFYSVLITDANGCTLNAAANIYQPALPVSVSATITPISCFGYQDGAISVVVSGGVPSYALSWSNNQNTFLVDTLVAGFYALQVLDFNGCTSQWNFNVSQPTTPLLLSVAATPASCYNGNNGTVDLTPTGGTAPYTYLWNNGATTQDLNSLLAGSYSVVVSDANGCQATISATILQPQPFSSSATLQNINCYSQNTGAIDLSVVGGTAPYTYLWNNGATTQDLNNILAASYSVSITDANTCVITNTFTLSQPLIPTTLSLQLTQPSCFAASNGSINLSVSSGNASLSYLWNNNQTTQDINNIPSGFYSVSVTDNLGCIDTISTFLNQPDTIGITAILTNPSCPGALNASIDLSITGGTAPYTFTWLSGQNTEDIFNLAQGTYFVTVTDTNGCSKTATFTLVDPVQVASTYTFTPPTCFGGSNATLNVTVTGGAGPYTYLWASGQTTEDLVNVTAGNDTIYITDALGCPHSMVTTITQPDSIQLNFVITNINCFGAANGAIDLSVSGGTPGYTYLWNNAVTTQDLTNLNIGTYILQVTDNNGCFVFDTLSISQASSPISLLITGSNISCFAGSNGSVNLTVQGGVGPYLYNWSNGATTEDLSGLGAGTYVVVVTDSNGCQNTTSLVISTPAAALTISNALLTNIQCFNQSTGVIDITVSGGSFPYTYTWSNPAGTLNANTQDLFNIPAGGYHVDIVDFNGCTTFADYTLVQPVSGAVISYNVQPVFCFGDSTGWINATVIGGALPYGFSWSNGVNAEDLFNIPSGNYTLTVTDNIGCVTTANILVAQPSGPLFANAIVNNQSCFGFVNASINANVIGGSAPYSISWNTGQTTSLIGPLVNGNYALNVVDSLGCALDSVFTITQPNPLLIPGAVVNVACFGDSSAYITALPNGGTAPYAYAWNNGQNTQVDTLIPAGNYIVTVTDFNGCIDSALFAVTQPLAPIALTLIQTNVGCFGANTGALDLSVTGGTPAYSYLWSNAFTSQDIQNLSIGNYGVIVTDANGCTDTILTTITQPISPLIVLPTITNSPCFASNGGSIDLNVYGGTTPYTYFWNTTDTTQDLSAVPAGQYSVAVTDANNCVSSLIINITQPASGTNINITQTPASCYGYNDGTMTANVNGGVAPYTVLWNNNLTTSTINNLSAGIYTVTVTDANGCQVSASQLLNQPDSLIAQFNIPDNFGCAPFQAQLINNSIGQYSNVLWTIGNGDILFTADTAYYTFNQVGCYDISLTVTSANGCMATTTENSAICVAQGPIASFYSSPEQIDFYTGDIQFINTSAGANNTYFWNFGDGTQSQTINPFHSYPDQTPATYEVLLIAVDTNGCVDSILQVYELNEIIVMNVPNAFTINEDGLNDAFKPIFSSPESIVKYDFTIFNRWGEIIYQTNDPSDAWDGKYQGKFVQTGAYNWTVNYSDINKADVFAKGHVVVLK